MNTSLKHFLIIALAFLPPAFMAITWQSIPDIVPTHFGVNGPDVFGNKVALWLPTLELTLASLFAYFLLQYIHRIDPKRIKRAPSLIYDKLSIGLIIFLVAINFTIILMSTRGLALDKVLFSLIGLLFVFLGNIMYSLKPNYFAGIRIPWTLHSDYNWRLTHRFAGKLWFATGLLYTIISLFLPTTISAILIPILVGVFLVACPIVYSFVLFQQETKNPDIAKQDDEPTA